MQRPAIKQQITFLRTNNLERVLNFYQDILGFVLTLDQGNCLIVKVFSTGYIGFCENSDLDRTESVIVTLVVKTVAEVDEWHQYLEDRQILVEKPPSHNQKYNIYHLFFRDPNNYLLEVQTFFDPSWPAK